MTEGYGDLNGSGPQQIYINVYRTGYQNWNENFTDYRIIVRYLAKGYGSFDNSSTMYWSAWSGGGNRWNGSFKIPSPGTADITLLDTVFRVYHDGNGFMGGFWSGADIDTNHTRIGDGGVSVPEEAAPRIPKRPSEPGTPYFSEALPTSVRVSWGGSGDNRGSGIHGYLLRYWPNAEGSGGYIDHSQQNNTSRLVTGLTPGQHYRFTVYAQNSAADNNGYSNRSGDAVIRMLSGVRVKVNGQWRLAIPYVRSGGVWRMAMPFAKQNGSWKMTN